jgi:hypothetical protein
MRYLLLLFLLLSPPSTYRLPAAGYTAAPPLALTANANPASAAPGQSVASVVGVQRALLDRADVRVRIAVDPDLEILDFGTWGDTCARQDQLIACVVTVRGGEGALIGLDLRASPSARCAPYHIHVEAATKFSDETAISDLLIPPSHCALFLPLVRQ